MTLYAISDIHIWGNEDPLYQSLIALVKNRSQPQDVIVLAGDIFDAFVGNKKVFVEEYSQLIEAIHVAASSGVQIHYIEGNHDFLLKKVFAGFSNVFVHSDEVTFDFDQKKFFFCHGDLANPHDYGYRLLRAFLRSPFLRFLAMIVPGPIVRSIATRSSRYSREMTPRLPTELPIERRERLRKIYRNYAVEKIVEGYDYVVMGHCHDLDEKMFKVGSRTGQYVNVGYPRAHGSFLSWKPGDERIEREKL